MEKYLLAGDSSIIVQFGNEINEQTNHKIMAFNTTIKELRHTAIIETVPSYCSLMIHYNSNILKYNELVEILNDLTKKINFSKKYKKNVIEIPVLYGEDVGVDIENVAKYNNLKVDEVIDIHSSREYLIYMLGFTPGFPYLGGMDKRIATPRLEKPRVKIEAGSIGIAGEQTGIYPISSPGGWQIIGRTPLKLFDINRKEPFLLRPGQYVKFKPISKDEFDKLYYEDLETNKYINKLEDKYKGITIRNGGFLTTVQDLGRYKYQEFGVSVSGAMDLDSLKLANILVGNDINEAVLEMTMIGATLEFECDNTIAITGGNLTPQINGVEISMNTSIVCKKGDILSFGAIKSGSRAYVSFAGGLSVPSVMNSKSTYIKAMLGGINGRKLEKGDKIGFNNPYILNNRYVNITDSCSNEINLRVIMGPQDDCFTDEGIETFLKSTYTVSNEFDRMGCRLDGNKIQHKKDGNIISDGIALGAIQVPSHGTPIIMLADRQTIGGYTKIANVISVDLPKIAQSKPGDKVKFERVSIEEAQALYDEKLKEFEQIKINLNKPVKTKVNYYKIYVNNNVYDVSVEEKI